MDLCLQKYILMFLKNFRDFKSDTIEKQAIVNVSNYRNGSCAYVVVNDSKVTFPYEEDDSTLRPFLYYASFYARYYII